MIKFILRKTVFKKYDKETQDHLLPFLTQKYTTICFCFFMFHFLIYLAPMILLGFAVNGREFDSFYNIILGIAIVVYTCILLISYAFYVREIINFTTVTLPDKLYNRIYAQRGKAISKQDFKKIQCESNDLYQVITSHLCHGYCYAICFEILKVLKTGNIKFIAVRKIKDADEETETYTMHVLYEKNGWVFDTYNQHQYSVEKDIALHKGIVYKDFYYEDIKGLTYDEFRDKTYDELAKWCKEHDCYQSWKKDE